MTRPNPNLRVRLAKKRRQVTQWQAIQRRLQEAKNQREEDQTNG